jgi:hypothetical protein
MVAGKALERLEDAGEVFTLIGQQLRERLFPVGDVVRENHLAHRRRCGRLRRTCARCG